MRAPKPALLRRLQLEHLEERSVPATATLTNGTINILGTGAAEQIDVTQSGATLSVLGQNFDAGQVHLISIDAGDGDDTITINAAVTATTWVFADGGHDRINTGSGTTFIYGGTGNDTITGGAGNDTIYGGPGANSISAQAGDTVTPSNAWQSATMSSLAQQILQLVNQQRAANGLAPLQASGQLTAAADLHSRDMVSMVGALGPDGAMAHTLLGVAAPTLASRAAWAGYEFSYLGENIAYGFPDAQSVMNAWMNSPGHRANILNPSYTQIGIAIAYTSSGLPYFTQFFGTPLPSNPAGPGAITAPTSSPAPAPQPAPTPTPAPAPSPTPAATPVSVTAGFSGGPTRAGQIYATGAGAGSTPTVTVYDMASGGVKFRLMPYASTFRGGVRVAVADITGDGHADVITAPGPGAVPLVRVYDGASGALTRSFYAFSPLWTGGVFIAAGDVNGDGRADIVASTDRGSAGRVRAFDGRSLAVFRDFFAYGGTRAGARVAVGDINGDGRADIVTTPGPGISPLVRIYSGAGGLLHAFYAYDPRWYGGVFVATGDINGDGRADIVTGADAGAGAHVKGFSGGNVVQIASFFTEASFTGGLRVAVRDVTGDGAAEIITAQGAGGRQVRLHSSDGGLLANFLASESTGVYVA